VTGTHIAAYKNIYCVYVQ